MARTHKLLQLDGVRIHAVEEGEGPLVLMVHGFPESWYSWRHQLTALANAGYKAVAIDQRGYGQSSKFRDNDAYRIHPLVDDLRKVIDHYGEKKAVVIGHDWGAPVTWTFAWLHPERCRGVVGISVPFADRMLIGLPGNPWGAVRPAEYHKVVTGPGRVFYQDYFGEQTAVINEIESDLRGWLRSLYYTVSGEGVGELVAMAAAAGAPAMTPLETLRHGPLCMPEGAKLKDAFLSPKTLPAWFSEADLDFYVAEFERSGFGGPLAYYRNVDQDWADLASQAGKPLTPPAYFIGSDFDVGTQWGMENVEQAAQRMPNYRGTHLFSGVGHWIQQERPEETNRLLIDFLRGLDR
jgi:pimeloyl-ACP methyl ester carboxylesterase